MGRFRNKYFELRKRAMFECLVQKVKNFNFILIIIAGHVFMIILKFRLETSSGNTVEMEVLFLFQITLLAQVLP